MIIKGSTSSSTAPASQERAPHRAALIPARRDLFAALALALLALALTLAYYGAAYRTAALADDRIRGLFAGFQSLEGEGAQPYRWSKGEGSVCLPAIGLTRPRAALELRLLGSSVTANSAGRAIDSADLRVGELRLPLRIAPEDRAYRLLLPPAPQGGPVCVTILSDTVDPQGNGRVAGVGLRSLSLSKLGPGGLPPPDQLLANLWLSLGGFWLLRRLGLPRPVALPAVLALTAAIGGALLAGALRVAPDLPFWSMFAAVSLGLALAALGGYQWAAPRLRPWQREALGTALILLLLAAGWAALSRLEGYIWPFPLMARAGSAFGWGALPAVALFALFAGLILRWLRAPAPPPAPLAIGAAFLAALLLPAALKAGLRGWESLFQTFLQEGNYIRDVPRVGADPLGFLRDYVALMPELELHNKTHPPGATLFLWGVEQVFGPGPGPAAWVVIAVAALGVWPTYRLAEALLGRRAALLAAAIYALLPAFMTYAATSLDALYATVLAFAIQALYAAFVRYDRPGEQARQLWAALAAGAWIALGLLLSFTTLMLAFVVLALVARRLAIGPRRPADALRWAAAGGALGGAVLLILGAIWAATGYDSIAAFFSGVANNRVDVGERVSPLGLSSYLFFLAVNAVSFGWFLGPWLIYRLGAATAGAVRATAGTALQRPAASDDDRRPATDDGAAGAGESSESLALGLGALILGMLLSGLFFREIERVWLFSHILIAAVLAGGIMDQRDQRGRLALAAILLTTLFLHSVIFRATLRVSW